MASYQLEQSYLQYCQGTWDGTRYRDSTQLESLKCCTNPCKENRVNCVSHCKNSKTCTDKCMELYSNCIDNCLEYTDTKNISYINSCATSLGCGNYPLFDKECVKNKQDGIIACCRDKCTINDLDKCDDCTDYYKYLFSENNIMIKNEALNDKVSSKKDFRISIYITLGFLIFLLIIYMFKGFKIYCCLI